VFEEKNYMNGILLVDKPSGMTSHDVVDFIRRKFGFKKVGHAGTLDPLATGLLVILIGSATKRSQFLTDEGKSYEATIALGIHTDTGDREGKVLSIGKCDISREEIEKILLNFVGEIEQVPPMFSAKKHKGKRLYVYARKGIEVKRKARKITVKKIEILNFSNNKIFLSIDCSKGTYIRQLACDIGMAIGCGAHIVALRRTRSGQFGINNCVKLDELAKESMDTLNESILRN